ncbi:zinc ribbon domain-containing protein [archaeon]|nr:zinc ribbon domain-containing protein [archaeon]MBL7057344.1 zinc ribbon domain-containing protein [Candidatus Woesearchaeota archaeon]
MPYCSKCGFQADDDDSFCTRCGAEIKFSKDTKNDVDWKKKEEESTWKTFKHGMKHTFFDTEERLSKKRKTLNLIIIILIVVIGISILAPYLDNIKFNIGGNNNGDCKYRLDATQLSITDAVFSSSNNSMNMLITNHKQEDIVLEKVSKTYEFRFDSKGDTEEEFVTMLVPVGRTLKLTFTVRQEPHIIGLDFSGCEKAKVSEWDTN